MQSRQRIWQHRGTDVSIILVSQHVSSQLDSFEPDVHLRANSQLHHHCEVAMTICAQECRVAVQACLLFPITWDSWLY